MSREIKFRCWDKISKIFINNIIIDPLTIIISSSSKYLPMIAECNNRENLLKRHNFDPKDFIIQQYTGTKDENNKEIYEGDILEWYWGDYPRYLSIGEVKFQEYEKDEFSEAKIIGFCLTNIFNTDLKENRNWKTSAETLYSSGKQKIIGNIFENPELLK